MIPDSMWRAQKYGDKRLGDNMKNKGRGLILEARHQCFRVWNALLHPISGIHYHDPLALVQFPFSEVRGLPMPVPDGQDLGPGLLLWRCRIRERRGDSHPHEVAARIATDAGGGTHHDCHRISVREIHADAPFGPKIGSWGKGGQHPDGHHGSAVNGDEHSALLNRPHLNR